MKTFKQFQEETQQIDEALPLLGLIPAALKLGGAALTAYSAGSALNNLRKGKFKQAGLDALGAIPGGKVFKAAKFLGAGKNLARTASAVQSANRFNLTGLTPNAYAKGVDKTFDVATKSVQKGFNTLTGKNKNKKTNQVALKQYKPKIIGNAAKSTALGSSVPKMGSAGESAAKRVALGSSVPKMGSAGKIGAQTLKGGKKKTS